MNDLISVIIPVYKVEEYLDDCMRSILDQTYRNLEIILV
ncbi:MAG: glycosyltransferase, partial [Lachnospiraceae bacterium]